MATAGPLDELDEQIERLLEYAQRSQNARLAENCAAALRAPGCGWFLDEQRELCRQICRLTIELEKRDSTAAVGAPDAEAAPRAERG